MKSPYFDAVLSDAGAPLLATVTVYLAGTQTLAKIYTTPAGTVEKDNPFQTDSLGRFQFFADRGWYDVKVSGTGITTYTISNVLLGITDTSADFFILAAEFLWNFAGSGWGLAAINAGTLSTPTPILDHPGAVWFSSSVTANSGYYAMSNLAYIIGGSEITEFIFKTSPSFPTVVSRLGFQDSWSSAVPSNGAWININTDVLSGKTYSGGSGSTTPTTKVLDSGGWYRAKIVVNAAANRVDFYLYNASGTLLWTDYLTTNIPTAAVAHGVLSTSSGTTAIPLLCVDYMSLMILRKLTR
jgi:hypothetical protein